MQIHEIIVISEEHSQSLFKIDVFHAPIFHISMYIGIIVNMPVVEN